MIKHMIMIVAMLVLSGCNDTKKELPVTFKPHIQYCEGKTMTGVFMKLSDDEQWYLSHLLCDKNFSASSVASVEILNSVPAGAIKVGMSVLYENRTVSNEEKEFFIRSTAGSIGANVVTLTKVKSQEGEEITLVMGYRNNRTSHE